MNLVPPLPSWDAAHPIIIHVPLGALPLAVVFVLLAIVSQERWSKPFAVSALIVMLIGTLGAFLAVMSGEAAHELAEGTGPLSAMSDPVLEQHEELAELARTIFAILTVLYVVVIIASSAMRKKHKKAAAIGAQVVFVLLYLPALVLLADAAHRGGRLVHEFGIHAPVARYSGNPDAALPPAQPGAEDIDD